MEESNSNKRKKPLDIDWDQLLPRDAVVDDDSPPEIVITSAEQSNDAGGGALQPQMEKEDLEYQLKTDDELEVLIGKTKKNIMTFRDRLPDKGEKLRGTLRRCEAEVARRRKLRLNKGDNGCADTIHLSDQSDDGASCGRKKGGQKSLASSKFAHCFSKNMEDKDSRTVNAFEDELSLINTCQRRKAKQNDQSGKGRSRLRVSSRRAPFRCPTTLLVDGNKGMISNGDKKGSLFAACSPRLIRNKTDFFQGTHTPQDHQPSRNMKSRRPQAYSLVDEEPLLQNMVDYAIELDDCMKDVTVYYPSRDDADSVEVIYTDLQCLAPEAYLSSTIMNFYIRYLRQLTSSSENATCKYHFFNTYFYNKLQKLTCREHSFVKFRKWWKGVNIFEKAYILLPIHECAHWSLGIICFPTKEDGLGPILLHMDSLGLHDSRSVFNNIRSFVKEEWNYLRNSEDPLDLPINDVVWENLGCRMDNRRIMVPQQRNDYDCGLFVLSYMERFVKEAPERLRKKDLSMFGKQWFHPEEASNLRVGIHNILVREFKNAKENKSVPSPD